MRWPWRRDLTSGTEQVSPLTFPYYVDGPGLRALANSLGIDLPTEREKESGKRFSVLGRGVGGERSWRDTSKSEGHIHLNRLAAQLKQSAAYRDVVDVLGHIPQVHEVSILRIAISHMEYAPHGEGDEPDSAAWLISAYKAERRRKIAAIKREELRQVAEQNQLVILRGTFQPVPSSSEGNELRVRLTHLEQAQVVYDEPETPASPMETEGSEMELPDEVGIEAVLPEADSFTPGGRERLGRRAPFYGRLIAHSASFDEHTGVLTCCAYAVWGMPRPAVLMERLRDYDFLEDE